MRMKFLRYFLVICFLSFSWSINSSAQVDPEDPPDDGTGEELGVPLSGSDIFYLVALGLGGILIYGQRKKPKSLGNR